MSMMTVEDRLRSAEKRLEALEGVVIELLQANAHQLVGGRAWADADVKRIQIARHE